MRANVTLQHQRSILRPQRGNIKHVSDVNNFDVRQYAQHRVSSARTATVQLARDARYKEMPDDNIYRLNKYCNTGIPRYFVTSSILDNFPPNPSSAVISPIPYLWQNDCCEYYMGGSKLVEETLDKDLGVYGFRLTWNALNNAGMQLIKLTRY